MRKALSKFDAAENYDLKILVLHTGPLFAHDDARLYVNELRKTLIEVGHSIESISLPFVASLDAIVSQSAGYRLLDVAQSADLCIAVGPFSYALNHPNKHVWLLSRYSPVYEHWDTRFGGAPTSSRDLETREYVHAADRAWLSEARAVCVGSHMLAEAVFNTHGIKAAMLPPTMPDGYLSSAITYENHFVAVGCTRETTRIPLIIEGFARTTRKGRLLLMAFAYSSNERKHIEQIVSQAPNAGSITLEINPSYERIFQSLSSAVAFLSVPYLCEAMDIFSIAAGLSRKMILTTSDSGELARVVEDRVDGRCAEPNATALAHAMDEILGNKKAAQRLGDRFYEKLHSSLPSWNAIAMEFTK